MKRIALLLTIICFALMTVIPSAIAQQTNAECSREELKNVIDKFFAALETNDISKLPLASNARYTENGIEKPVGENFWKTAGKTLLRRDLVDTQYCGTLSNVVIEEAMDRSALGERGMVIPGIKPPELVEDGKIRPIMAGIRLKVENKKITEIEAIIAREHDFAFNVEGQLGTKGQGWESILPRSERSSRMAMIAAADDYFDMFAEDPDVHTPFAYPCDRWENGYFTTGGGSFPVGGENVVLEPHDCTPQGLVIPNHGPRRFLVDVKTGQVVAIMHFAGSLPDIHVFKMRNGKVELINSVIGSASPSMGWPIEPVCF